MTALQRPSYLTTYFLPVVGLVGAVSLTMLGFASGLAAIDHISLASHRTTVVHAGSFGTAAPGDYRLVAPQRVAPQRATTTTQ